MSGFVVLVEAEVTSPAGETQTLRFSDYALAPFPAGSSREHLVWENRLIEPPTLRRDLVDNMATLTPSLGVGVMLLANGDGGLDPWRTHVWQQIRVYLWTPGTAFEDASILFTGLSTQPRFQRSSDRPRRVQVGFFDPSAAAERPLQPTLYAGDGDYEGEPEGLKGQPKPLAFGDLSAAHVQGRLVDPGSLTFQLNDGPIEGEVEIFDRGAEAGYAFDGDYADAAFDAFVPDPAAFATDVARGLVKINGDPVGQITFGLQGDAGEGFAATPGPVMAAMLARAGVSAGQIGASVAALPADAPIGVYAADVMPAVRALALAARSAPAALLPDRLGVWQALPIAPPAEEPDYILEAWRILRIEADEAAAAPAGVVRVGWGRTWTAFDGDQLAPALRDTPAAEALKTNLRWAVVEDAEVKARPEGAWRTIEIETALREEADALALAASLRELLGLGPDGAPRTAWRVSMALTPEALAVPLGATVRLVYPPFDLDGRYLLIGEEPFRPRRNLITWTLWG